MKEYKKIVFITGASSGIGKACAEHLVQQGYNVFGTSRKISSSNLSSFEMIKMDVKKDESVKQAIEYVACTRGQIFFNIHEHIDPKLTPVTWAELQYINKNPGRLEHITNNPYFMKYLAQDSRIWRTPDLMAITTFIVDWYF